MCLASRWLAESLGSVALVLVARRASVIASVWRCAAASKEEKGCAHCAHSGLWTGSYRVRIGPDFACFREFPVFAGAGMQFDRKDGPRASPYVHLSALWASCYPDTG